VHAPSALLVEIWILELENMTNLRPTPFSPICLGLLDLFVPNGRMSRVICVGSMPVPLSRTRMSLAGASMSNEMWPLPESFSRIASTEF
jgi:hypothetical protein